MIAVAAELTRRNPSPRASARPSSTYQRVVHHQPGDAIEPQPVDARRHAHADGQGGQSRARSGRRARPPPPAVSWRHPIAKRKKPRATFGRARLDEFLTSEFLILTSDFYNYRRLSAASSSGVPRRRPSSAWRSPCALSSSPFLVPRSRSAAARSRPPTPLVFGFASSAGVFGLGVRIELAADQLDLRQLGAVALAVADAHQARVAAGTRREARRDRVEQLA